MFAITIDYLTGVCYANERAAGRPGVPEWPPHPERLFQALVASSTEHHHDALRWIVTVHRLGNNEGGACFEK